MKSIKDHENEILANLSAYHNHQDLTRYLIAQGKAQACLADDERDEADLIPGCLSKIWLRLRQEQGRLYYQVDGQSYLVKGLASLLLKLFSGQTPEAILAHRLSLFDRPPLASLLPRSKRNGLAQLVERIYADARRKLP